MKAKKTSKKSAKKRTMKANKSEELPKLGFLIRPDSMGVPNIVPCTILGYNSNTVFPHSTPRGEVEKSALVRTEGQHQAMSVPIKEVVTDIDEARERMGKSCLKMFQLLINRLLEQGLIGTNPK
jgi:hypothetical protein